MDLSTVVAAFASSGVISIGGAAWLTKSLVNNRLAKDLKDYQALVDQKLAASKAELDNRLASSKAELETTLHREVEEYLGEKAAERQYRLDARKRLYSAIGPLRFQLIMACADFANRISRIGTGQQAYATSLAGYFGRSTIFRFLRLFGISELIERQTAYADFSVDPSMLNLLHFKSAAFRCLSSGAISLNHPNVHWEKQVQHVFHDTLSIVAAAMIVSDANGVQRVMRFDEFNDFILDRQRLKAINPIPRLMNDFAISTKPIFWMRLVALGGLCSELLNSEGPHLGIKTEPFNGPQLLDGVEDMFIKANRPLYDQMLSDVASELKPNPPK